jgi:hypothetical protein
MDHNGLLRPYERWKQTSASYAYYQYYCIVSFIPLQIVMDAGCRDIQSPSGYHFVGCCAFEAIQVIKCQQKTLAKVPDIMTESGDDDDDDQ